MSQTQHVTTIALLVQELVDTAKGLPEFQDRGFSIYNVDDLQEKSAHTGFPVVGVAYEGMEVVQSEVPKHTTHGNVAQRGAEMGRFYYSIVVGVEYRAAGSDDTKAFATDLLDAVRREVIGLKGVAKRPWRLSGEAPAPGDLEGVIWYGQRWYVDLPLLGKPQT